ncbi:MAG: HD domain-containing protein [Clostridia bacterium]|nr:HD domain-containing protein [Clostridia bacterium]
MDTETQEQNPTLARMARLGADVLASPRMQALRVFIQHGEVTRYEHCLCVCYIAMRMAEKMRITIDERSMVRGALLHDFFMYDWHDPSSLRVLHGFTHPKEALMTAEKDFKLNAIERDVIRKHMFPLTLSLPAYRETVLVCLADKISALMETFSMRKALRIARMCRRVK